MQIYFYGILTATHLLLNTLKPDVMKVSKAFNPFEHTRLFFMGGLALSMSVVYLTFHWNGPELPKKSFLIPEVDFSEFTEIMIHTEEPEMAAVTKEEIIKEPEVQIVTPGQEVIVVDNKKELPKQIVLEKRKTSEKKFREPVIKEPAPKTTERKVYDFVEVEPAFPGGVQALYSYLSKEVQYPTFAKESNVEGTVWVSFVVDKYGNISDIDVLKSIGFGCDEEVVDAIRNMPKWTPGMQGGAAVDVRYKLPFKFLKK
jgi:protein TonB